MCVSHVGARDVRQRSARICLSACVCGLKTWFRYALISNDKGVNFNAMGCLFMVVPYIGNASPAGSLFAYWRKDSSQLIRCLACQGWRFTAILHAKRSAPLTGGWTTILRCSPKKGASVFWRCPTASNLESIKGMPELVLVIEMARLLDCVRQADTCI